MLIAPAACVPAPPSPCAATESCTALGLSSRALGGATLDDLEVVIASPDGARQRVFFRDRVITLPTAVPLPKAAPGATVYVRATRSGGGTATQLGAALKVTDGADDLAAELQITCDSTSCAAPPPRQYGALAYDGARRRLVLFGGVGDDGAARGDTWEWDGLRWSTADGASPGARSGHAMAFEPSRGRVILFGGERHGVGSDAREVLDDTWEFVGGGTGWRRLSVSAAPVARRFAALATGPTTAPTDTARPGLVLFGGESASGQPLGDTWIFDGQRGSWEKRAEVLCPLAAATPGVLPYCRSGAAMATLTLPPGVEPFGPVTGLPPSPLAHGQTVSVLLGGRGARATTGGGQGDDTVWGWDGEGWRVLRLPAAMPPATRGTLETSVAGMDAASVPRSLQRVTSRWSHQMAPLGVSTDGKNGGSTTLLISGGESEHGMSPDSFVLDLSTGNLAPVLGPAPLSRSGATLAYDAERAEELLVGGRSQGGALWPDTWTYSRDAGWTARR